jgi:hypothetical protein
MSDPAPAFDRDTMVDVHLLGLPVMVWSKTQEHVDELLREFGHIAEQIRSQGGPSEVPVRLTDLIHALTAEYGSLNTEQDARLSAAAAAGLPLVDDLPLKVPREAAGAVTHLDAMLDEADAYCSAGEHLLTLATPPELVRFRKWYLDEITGQMAGHAPVAWADYQS